MTRNRETLSIIFDLWHYWIQNLWILTWRCCCFTSFRTAQKTQTYTKIEKSSHFAIQSWEDGNKSGLGDVFNVFWSIEGWRQNQLSQFFNCPLNRLESGHFQRLYISMSIGIYSAFHKIALCITGLKFFGIPWKVFSFLCFVQISPKVWNLEFLF